MKKISKKFATLFLASLLTISTLPVASVNAAEMDSNTATEKLVGISEENVAFQPLTSIVNIAVYRAWRFTDRSSPQYIELQMDADFISIQVTCENPNDIDHLICNILGQDEGNDYAQSFPCIADGSAETIMISVPRGEYKVNFEDGDSSKNKVSGFVVFSVED